MKSFKCLAAVAALLVATRAHAQNTSPRLEIGMDAGIARLSFPDLPDVNAMTVVDLPIQAVRVGFDLTPLIALEPSLGVHSESGNGSFTVLTFDLGVPISLSGPMGTSAQYFVRPLVGWSHIGSEGEASRTQTSLGAGLGLRAPIIPRFALRLEARYRRGLKSNDFPSSNEVGILAGVSFFTR